MNLPKFNVDEAELSIPCPFEVLELTRPSHISNLTPLQRDIHRHNVNRQFRRLVHKLKCHPGTAFKCFLGLLNCDSF